MAGWGNGQHSLRRVVVRQASVSDVSAVCCLEHRGGCRAGAQCDDANPVPGIMWLAVYGCTGLAATCACSHKGGCAAGAYLRSASAWLCGRR